MIDRRKNIEMNLLDESHQRLSGVMDFSKIKVDKGILTDAVITGPLKRINSTYADKEYVLRAMSTGNVENMRKISDFFYKTSGIYSRLCRYLAYLFRYDWYITPYISGGDTYPVDSENGDIVEKDINKYLDDFFAVLRYMDSFNVKKFLGNVALKVVRNGCYYGYIIHNADFPSVQELPIEYCRTRYTKQNRPVVEFNMKYFNDYYKDTEYRNRVLKLFPEEFRKGYRLYQQGKLKGDYQGDTAGWWLLDPACAFKFNINDEDMPIMMAVIPAIIDLDEAQALDRKKMAQKLLKIIVQQMPLDKNGDPIFDTDEMQIMHNNAVRMLSRAIGVDVLTTMANVEVADMADRNTTTTTDDLAKVERAVYNEAGVSQMLFNTDGNIALEKSYANDAAMMSNLISQFEDFMNMIIIKFNKKPKKVYYQAQILPTTQDNYKELSKMYKEQMQLGFSKMLPQIALGQLQSTILATAYFENDLLNLVTVFVPPLMSSTMNADSLVLQQTRRTRSGEAKPGQPDGEGSGAGRPEKPEGEKSTKTLQNIESKN